MKRTLLTTPELGKAAPQNVSADPELQSISRYMADLRLLKDVPFSYLVPDESFLPPESIRFFCLDENWQNALVDGALSVGRVANIDAREDLRHFSVITRSASEKLTCYRFDRMHANHRRGKNAEKVASVVTTGLLLRSQLVGKWNGLEIFAYGGTELLKILRMEKLSEDILICIVDGELTKFVISEPKTGLRLGAPDNSGVITLRDISDTGSFGDPLDEKVNLNDHTSAKGRLDAAGLAREFARKLKKPVTSSEFAFELIAVAKRAEFWKGGD